MATLTKDTPRTMTQTGPHARNDLPVIASDIIYMGALVGHTAGNARPLVAADVFVGVALERSDNSAGAAGAKRVDVLTEGIVHRMAVTGATGITNIGALVYASDDDTLTLTATANTLVGRVDKFNTDDSTFDVFIKAVMHQVP